MGLRSDCYTRGCNVKYAMPGDLTLTYAVQRLVYAVVPVVVGRGVMHI